MILSRALIIFLTTLMVSCNSGSKVTEEDQNDTKKAEMMAEKMQEEGFYSGTIVFSDVEGDCTYTIDLDSDDYTYLLDPINLEENYKKAGMKIWLKFSGLRMASRCANANPVSIIEIQEKAQ